MESSERLLREHGIKVTPQRLSIVSELSGRVHMSIDDLYQSIKKSFPSISLATVYKNINAMMDMNFIQEVKIPNQKSRFELNKEPHSHLFCQKCGKVEDIELELNTITTQAAQKSGYKIDEQSLIFSGICPKCAKN
ncbi:MAG: transcriptional repressor [Sulfurospirillum sp.]|nr:MAG: transcriptional repressor [Sulfurospirillum sp.]